MLSCLAFMEPNTLNFKNRNLQFSLNNPTPSLPVLRQLKRREERTEGEGKGRRENKEKFWERGYRRESICEEIQNPEVCLVWLYPKPMQWPQVNPELPRAALPYQ